jgi:Firmicute plasmid replication protein (RepL)
VGGQAKTLALATQPKGSWVQTERSAHEKWAKLSISNPRASSLLHVLTHRMGRHNALIASQSNLARMAGCSVRTLQRALDILRTQNWIEVRQIGPSGTICAYIINDRVVWSGKREGIRYSLFSAAVIVSDDEQPDEAELEHQSALTRIPSLYPGERQLPTGDGLPPPSEPALPGLEPDLPATHEGSFKSI